MALHGLDHLLSRYGAGLVGVTVGLEAMGLPLPGESMVVAGALYCATTHHLSIGWVLAAAMAGAIVGGGGGYLIGRGLGIRFFARHGRRVGLSADRQMLGRYLFHRYGPAVVFFSRFVAILRTFAALLAGANAMDWKRFLLWNALGGIVWAGGYGLAAYWLGAQIEALRGPVGIVLGCVVGIAVVFAAFSLRRNEKRLISEARLHYLGLMNAGAGIDTIGIEDRSEP